jgi:hypothetical protein
MRDSVLQLMPFPNRVIDEPPADLSQLVIRGYTHYAAQLLSSDHFRSLELAQAELLAMYSALSTNPCTVILCAVFWMTKQGLMTTSEFSDFCNFVLADQQPLTPDCMTLFLQSILQTDARPGLQDFVNDLVLSWQEFYLELVDDLKQYTNSSSHQEDNQLVVSHEIQEVCSGVVNLAALLERGGSKKDLAPMFEQHLFKLRACYEILNDDESPATVAPSSDANVTIIESDLPSQRIEPEKKKRGRPRKSPPRELVNKNAAERNSIHVQKKEPQLQLSQQQQQQRSPQQQQQDKQQQQQQQYQPPRTVTNLGLPYAALKACYFYTLHQEGSFDDSLLWECETTSIAEEEESDDLIMDVPPPPPRMPEELKHTKRQPSPPKHFTTTTPNTSEDFSPLRQQQRSPTETNCGTLYVPPRTPNGLHHTPQQQQQKHPLSSSTPSMQTRPHTPQQPPHLPQLQSTHSYPPHQTPPRTSAQARQTSPPTYSTMHASAMQTQPQLQRKPAPMEINTLVAPGILPSVGQLTSEHSYHNNHIMNSNRYLPPPSSSHANSHTHTHSHSHSHPHTHTHSHPHSHPSHHNKQHNTQQSNALVVIPKTLQERWEEYKVKMLYDMDVFKSQHVGADNGEFQGICAIMSKIQALISSPLNYHLLRHWDDYAPHTCSNTLKIQIEIAHSFYTGDITAEVQMKVGNNYLPFNSGGEQFTMKCHIKTEEYQSWTKYNVTFQPSTPNFFNRHLDKLFERSRHGRVQFKIPTASGVVEVNSNHFEFKAKIFTK